MKAIKILIFISLLILLVSQSAIAQSARIVRGDLLYIVCATGVNVRADNLESIVFTAEGYEKIKPFQGWGENNKRRVVNGEAHTFVKVQFADKENRGEAIGWISKQFVKLLTDCPQGALPQPSLAGDPLKNISGLDDARCCFFPLKEAPKNNIRQSPTHFGASRGGGRAHAATDLYADLYDPVVSVAPGKILYGPKDFYMRTYEIVIRHTGGFIARYGEVSPKSQHRGRGVESGATVRTGQILAKVGQTLRANGSRVAPPMLHFELYSGRLGNRYPTIHGRFGGRYQRRSDLLNPTSHIEKWQRATF